MRHAAHIYISALALISYSSSFANSSHNRGDLQDSSGRGAIGQSQGLGQGQGSGIPGMQGQGIGGGMGGAYGGGGGNRAAGAREGAEKILEIGKKAEENISKGTEKFGSSLEKLSQSFNSSLANLKPAEDDKGLMKSLGEDIVKRKEASDGAPTVGDEIVADIVSGTKDRSDTWVETVKAKALTYQPEGPRPPAPAQIAQTVGDKIKQFSGGPSTRLGGNTLVRADQATNPSAQIPQMPGTAQHGGGGNTFGAVAAGASLRGAVGGPAATNPARIPAASADNYVENNFAVAQTSSSSAFGNVVAPRSGSVGALSAEVPSPSVGSRSSEVTVSRGRGAVSGASLYASDSDGEVRSVSGSRGPSPVEATQIAAIDSFISSSVGTRDPSNIDEEEAPKKKGKKKSARSARGARQSLLKSRK